MHARGVECIRGVVTGVCMFQGGCLRTQRNEGKHHGSGGPSYAQVVLWRVFQHHGVVWTDRWCEPSRHELGVVTRSVEGQHRVTGRGDLWPAAVAGVLA